MRHLISSLLACLFFLTACDGIDYEGNYNQGFSSEQQKRMVYFYHEDGVDSIAYSFSFEPHSKREHSLQVPVRIAGSMPKAALRYKVVVDESRSYIATPKTVTKPDNTTERVIERSPITPNYYTALNEYYQIEAGTVETVLPVVFSRDAINNGQIVHLTLRLEASDDLGVGFTKTRDIRLVVSNEIPEGYKNFWNMVFYPAYGLGPYSDEKFLKLLEFYGGDDQKLNADLNSSAFFLNLGRLYEYFKTQPNFDSMGFEYDKLKRLLPYVSE